MCVFFLAHEEAHRPVQFVCFLLYRSACDTEEINKARAGVSTGPLFFPSVHKGVPWQSHPMLAHTVTRASGSIDRSLLPDY